ncbi:aroma-sacti cluster domain-containing protein [Nonomuraea antri]|uniref:aroma-sacti cluster domain-containing protein n=1 Tax=Nonomuraea antri TaxID=2730852 RepID=UPI001C2C954C|nr:aroma-sacti cluster domain-containing protein [Nonomuraea antri]
MPFDALAALRGTGHPVDLLSDAQQAVFATLTEPEVEVLNRLKARLDAVAPEAEGHGVKIV